MNKTVMIASAVLGAACLLPRTATADDANADAAVRLVTEFRGSPPFKRRLAIAPNTVAERGAPLDTAADDSERVLVVERRGAPPYKRRFEVKQVLEVAEFARLEEVDSPRRTRRGPPGKMTSRR